MKGHKVLAVDPGTTHSAFVILEVFQDAPSQILEHSKVDNELMLALIKDRDYDTFAIEKIVSYGFKVGQTTFDTCEWSGRFIQAATDRDKPVERLKRKSVVAHCTGLATNGDTAVRAAMVAIYGEVPKLVKDQWSALAVATAWAEGLREAK